jgi:hypothetical protein
MNIQEQIDNLRGVNVIHGKLRSWPVDRCNQFADTLEKLLRVYEAAKAYRNQPDGKNSADVRSTLDDALDAVEKDGE